MTDASPAALPRSLLLVGAGKMGRAMLDGWLASGLAPEAVTVIDPGASVPPGVALNPDAPEPAEVAVLAVKPQMLAAAAPALRPWIGPGTLVVSVIAGKTVANLSAALGGVEAVVRAMPNLPAAIGRGATGAFATAATRPEQRAQADTLLRSVGLVEWVEREELIDAVTAVSGSGPAYLFHLCECLAAAGVAAGLEPGLAERLARATVSGAGELLATSDQEPAELRRNVTSPGGTTAAALEVLMGEAGLEPLLTRAVLAARRRAGELAG